MIARRYLVRRQLEANGLKAEQVEIDAGTRKLTIRAEGTIEIRTVEGTISSFRNGDTAEREAA